MVLCPRRLQNALPSAASSAPAELRAVPREPAAPLLLEPPAGRAFPYGFGRRYATSAFSHRPSELAPLRGIMALVLSPSVSRCRDASRLGASASAPGFVSTQRRGSERPFLQPVVLFSYGAARSCWVVCSAPSSSASCILGPVVTCVFDLCFGRIVIVVAPTPSLRPRSLSRVVLAIRSPWGPSCLRVVWPRRLSGAQRCVSPFPALVPGTCLCL